MQSRVQQGGERLATLFGTVVSKARVFQGGGNELTTSSLRAGVETAGAHALSRLFPKFRVADNPHWEKVIRKARDGAPDALKSVDWAGEVPANPVCKEVLDRTSGAGTKGSELHRELGEPLYGWPKDSIDGAILALLANGNIRAERDGHPVAGPKELPATQVGKTTFFKEDEPPSKPEQMAVRGVLTEAKVPYTTGQEAAAISGLLQHLLDLAERAGGAAPLPEAPDTAHVQSLVALAGNQQFRAVAQIAEQLRQDIGLWSTVVQQRATREASWVKLERLLGHAAGLEGTEVMRAQRDAVLVSRLLLEDPDPVAPLITSLCAALRSAVSAAAEAVSSAHTRELKQLEASSEWQQLSAEDRSKLLFQESLTPVDVPPVAIDDELLDALDGTPLAGWKEREQALPTKSAAARTAAARKLEPRSVQVKPASATIKTEPDVEAYVSALRKRLMEHVAADETVII